MRAKITWDAGWGTTSIEIDVAGPFEAVTEARELVLDAIETNMEGPDYYDFMSGLQSDGEIEVSVRVKSVEQRSAGDGTTKAVADGRR